MAIFPVLIDGRPPYLGGNGASCSLLLSPAGTQSVLGRIYDDVAAVTDEPVTVVTTFAVDREYEARVRRAGLPIGHVASIDDLDEMLGGLEPSDWLLLVDAHHLPVERADLGALVDNVSVACGARHFVAQERSRQGTKEYVELDALGRVRRIQRYYDGVTWLQAQAVADSLVPVSAAREVPPAAFGDLTALREALVAGGVVSCDTHLRAGTFDLRQEYGLLQLCEHHLRDLASTTPPREYSLAAPGVWVGPRCTIHPTARLYGPVVLQEGASVEARAKLIGPMLVGANGRVSPGAVLARCLVAPETVVPERTTSQYRVLCGENGNGSVRAAGASRGSFADRLPERLPVALSEQSSGRRNGKGRREMYVAAKRVVEGVVALLGLVLLSPLLLVTAAAIRLTSRGPMFFYHEREGKDGKPFRCCKFRTMVADAHRQQRALYSQNVVDGPQFDLRDDPRITRLGRWLRLTNIDELPQLFHVLLGQMSLIGPRPSPFRENQICVPWREARLAVRPGITGLWQICRQDRAASDFHQWIYYDMLYVRHLSVWLDVKILLATLLTLAGRWTVPVTRLIPARKLREAGEPLKTGRWASTPLRGRSTSTRYTGEQRGAR